MSLSGSRGEVALILDSTDPIAASRPVAAAVEQLRAALTASGLAVTLGAEVAATPTSSRVVLVAGPTAPAAQALLGEAGIALPDGPESLALAGGRLHEREVVLATGSDARGVVYAVRELADRVEHADEPLAALVVDQPIVEQPANPIRGVARLFVSDVEDLSWLHDCDGWRRYLSMLATHRFNRVQLAFGIGHDFLRNVLDAYLLFAYPFLLDVPGYDVRAVDTATGQPLPASERERNLDTLRFISDESAAVGVHFQLGLWTHGYTWTESPNASHLIEGLTPENHAAYCHDALRMLLQACSGIAGVTLRVHGESGVTEGNDDFWEKVFQGVATCGRPVELDLHPKGVDRSTIDRALQTGLSVMISPKHTAEHMGLPGHQIAIRPTEHHPEAAAVGAGDHFVENLMNRSAFDLRYTRYGYADFLGEDRPYGIYYRIWPGTQRLLLWGDPALAAGYGREGTFAGCLGVEVMEPLSFKGRRGSGLPGGRDAYADASLRPAGGAWEKYHYTFRLFGRLLYNPDTDPDVWQRALRHDFGAAAGPAGAALASSSRILPLITSAHHPSAANNRYWPEIYTNMPIVDAERPHPYRDTPSPRRFGAVSPLDPGLFSTIDEVADQLVAGQRDGRHSPLWVAARLERLADEADDGIRKARSVVEDPEAPAFRRLDVDVCIQATLGRFFAAKLRAGVAYELYRRTGKQLRLREAVDQYQLARAAWVNAIEYGRVYRDDITVGGEAWLRGHWSDRVAALDGDLTEMQEQLTASAPDAPTGARPVRLLELDQAPPDVTYRHTPPPSFERGQPLQIELRASADEAPRLSVRLHYRGANQAEAYQAVDMVEDDGRLVGTIPAAVTDSRYPLVYFFELRDRRDRAWLYPGLDESLANRPYFLVRQG